MRRSVSCNTMPLFPRRREASLTILVASSALRQLLHIGEGDSRMHTSTTSLVTCSWIDFFFVSPLVTKNKPRGESSRIVPKSANYNPTVTYFAAGKTIVLGSEKGVKQYKPLPSPPPPQKKTHSGSKALKAPTANLSFAAQTAHYFESGRDTTLQR